MKWNFHKYEHNHSSSEIIRHPGSSEGIDGQLRYWIWKYFQRMEPAYPLLLFTFCKQPPNEIVRYCEINCCRKARESERLLCSRGFTFAHCKSNFVAMRRPSLHGKIQTIIYSMNITMHSIIRQVLFESRTNAAITVYHLSPSLSTKVGRNLLEVQCFLNFSLNKKKLSDLIENILFPQS
jgi:hypothetical protein